MHLATVLEALAAANPLGLSGEVLYTSATAGLGIDALRERLLYEFFGIEGSGARSAARTGVAAAG